MINLRTIYINEKRKLGKWKTKRIVKRLEKANKKEDIAVALSNKLSLDNELIYEIESRKIKVLDGRWLFKLLLYDVLEFVSKSKDKRIETVNVSMIINAPDEIIFAQLIQIAEKVRSLKIVTNKINRFSQIEEKLYIDYGIAVQITSNREKAMLNSDIIINIDEYDIDKYKISNSASVVNIGYNVQLNNENFYGEVINWYEIEYNKEILEGFEERDNYDHNVIYESMIYKRAKFMHIKKQLDLDGVRLTNLYQKKA